MGFAACAALALWALAAPGRATAAPPAVLRADAEFAAPDGAAALAEPAGVVCDPLGQVWATDAAGDRLVRWDATGMWKGETGGLGSDANQFRRPAALARLGSLGVAVLDAENRRIVAYDRLGRRTDLVVALDDPALESAVGRVAPDGLAADRGGALYVVDGDRDRLLEFDFAGGFRGAIGGFGGEPGRFHGLVAAAVAARGELVTLERPVPPRRRRAGAAEGVDAGAPARVQWLEPGGAPLRQWALDAGDAREFALAVDDSGRVAVALAGGRADEVRIYTRDGVLLARTADVATPRALAFGPGARLFVAEAAAARVRRFVLAPPAGE